jgi:hypothetical protein
LVQVDQAEAATDEDPEPSDHLHLLELSATGEVTLDYREPIAMDTSFCLSGALTESGFALVTREYTEGGGTTRRLRRVERSGGSSFLDWSVSPATLVGLAVSDDYTVVVHQAEPPAILRIVAHAAASFPLYEDAKLRAIPSEAGTIYLDLAPYASDGSRASREIVEIRCVD